MKTVQHIAGPFSFCIGIIPAINMSHIHQSIFDLRWIILSTTAAIPEGSPLFNINFQIVN